MGISTETFWRQVRFLQRHYRIVGLCEALQLLQSGDVKVPTIALTFDDGYEDNFVGLRGVAEEAGIPITSFVALEPVEMNREFDHDLGNGIRGFLPLTWEQIRYWNLRGAEFGSHTRTHLDCGSTDRQRLATEIVGSRNDLENQLGNPVRFFAFPFGKHLNMSPEALELAASTYQSFLSWLGGENLPGSAVNHQHLFRKSLYADLWELALELQSVFDLVAKIKRRLHIERAESGKHLAVREILRPT
jgi:peptidoglycan/xylan/chitin deacetylase (PgdA/CDA1 family)